MKRKVDENLNSQAIQEDTPEPQTEPQTEPGTASKRGRPKGSGDSKPRKRPPRESKKDSDGKPLLPGENSKYIAHLWEVGSIVQDKVDFNDAKLVEYVIGKYFAICVKDDMKPSMAGLAVAFHTVRKTLLRWLSCGFGNADTA